MSNSRWLLTALLTSTTLLTGCATASSCPPAPEYDEQFRERLSTEIERLPDDSALLRAMGDYYVLRHQVLVCRGVKVTLP